MSMRLNQHENTRTDTKRARNLRNEASRVERKLWHILSEQSAARGLKFRRQHPIHPYIVDFACLSAKLLIEIDGDSHDARQRYDSAREQKLKNEGYMVLRFSNQDVLENALGVVETILNYAESAVQEKVVA